MFTQTLKLLTADIEKKLASGKMTSAEHAKNDANQRKADEILDALLADDDDKVCTELRKIAADNNFDID